MQDKSLMFYMIRSELEDAVGAENVSTKEVERAVYSVDYFWLSRKWQDAGETGPMPDIIVRPGSTEEVSKVMKIANYYKIPVTTWGGGSGSQGGFFDCLTCQHDFGSSSMLFSDRQTSGMVRTTRR